MQEDDWPGVRCSFWLKSDFFYLSQKFKHDLWRLKKKLKLSRKQHLTPVQNHSDTWHDTNRMQTKQWRHILSVKNSNEINCNCFINNDIMFVIRLGKKTQIIWLSGSHQSMSSARVLETDMWWQTPLSQFWHPVIIQSKEIGCGLRHLDIQYIPRNMHTVLLCFALLWLCNRS